MYLDDSKNCSVMSESFFLAQLRSCNLLFIQIFEDIEK